MLVTLKINGMELQADTDKFHETWLAKCLAYGVRRLPNDAYSGEKGELKHSMVKALIADMESGKPAPIRVQGAGRTSANPVDALARKNAKADLSSMFRAVTGKTKAIDFSKHEKVAPFFVVVENKAAWEEKTVTAWIGKQAKAGKRDYQADAKATLESVESADDLDF